MVVKMVVKPQNQNQCPAKPQNQKNPVMLQTKDKNPLQNPGVGGDLPYRPNPEHCHH
jgi:hypothetical protein